MDVAARKLRALCENETLRRRLAALSPGRIAALRAKWQREELEAMAFFNHYAPASRRPAA
jgi:hypothetical protein